MLRLDLHIHTRYSKDSHASIKSIVARCLKSGFGLVAITDHDNIQGALAMQCMAPFPVIIGEEISSSAGHIIGLFLQEAVPRGLPALETTRRIKDQGGLVVAPHPCCRLRPGALGLGALTEILPWVDFIEGYNPRTVLPGDNARGLAFAQKHAVPVVASSDSHSALELGRTFTEAPENEYDGTPQGLVRAVKAGSIVSNRPNPLLLMAPGYARIRKALELVGWEKDLRESSQSQG